MRVHVQCFTNLDVYKSKEWPTSLPGMPLVGHHVQARNGARLRIVSLIWTSDVLLVELHH